MTNYCVFRLYGPMAAFGGTAVGENRHTYAHPAKSAVLGLIAGALGVRREEEDIHQKLSAGYGFAVLVDSPGVPLQDFHTAQTSPAVEMKKQRHFVTRKDELGIAKERLETVLSRRDYLCDFVATVCLWQQEDAVPFSPEAIAKGLNHPVFVPYLGRKSCPLSIPTEAQVIEADSVLAAFCKADFGCDRFLRQIRRSDRPGMYWEDGAVAGVGAEERQLRRDKLTSRKRWQFADRKEYYARVDVPRRNG
jgi:CRISPR system Cascade subunit CasD